MTGEDIFGLIILTICSLGIGALCFCLGLCAEHSQKPFGFWTFKEVKPDSISDISAYNRENGKMWKQYAVPFFFAAGCAVGGIWFPFLLKASVWLMAAVCTLGIVWLIWQYNRIFRKYGLERGSSH